MSELDTEIRKHCKTMKKLIVANNNNVILTRHNSALRDLMNDTKLQLEQLQSQADDEDFNTIVSMIERIETALNDTASEG